MAETTHSAKTRRRPWRFGPATALLLLGGALWRWGATVPGAPAVVPGMQPRGLAFDATEGLYIADPANHRVWRMGSLGTIGAAAGTGDPGCEGDGGPALGARLHGPSDVAFDPTGRLVIADAGNQRVRQVDRAGIITTVAGSGQASYSGDGGPAVKGRLRSPTGIAFGPAGDLYIADWSDARVRRVDARGIITTVAGTGERGGRGNGGPAVSARLLDPARLAFDSSGNLYIADTDSGKVRRVDLRGIITATDRFGCPCDLAFDSSGDLYVADQANQRVWKSGRDGVLTTVSRLPAGFVAMALALSGGRPYVAGTSQYPNHDTVWRVEKDGRLQPIVVANRWTSR